MEIFDHYDKIQYGDFQLTNILRRAKPIKRILDKVDVYFPYTIKEGERADTIAFDYYGSSTYAWLIYITNQIYDPYYQWPLTDRQLFNFIQRKYGDFYQTQVDLKGYTNPDYEFIVSEFTFNQWSQEQRFGWSPLTIYQWEVQQNEAKRQIKLVSNDYIDVIDKQIREMFK